MRHMRESAVLRCTVLCHAALHCFPWDPHFKDTQGSFCPVVAAVYRTLTVVIRSCPVVAALTLPSPATHNSVENCWSHSPLSCVHLQAMRLAPPLQPTLPAALLWRPV